MRIAMLLHKSVEHDSRVRREASALAAAGHDVVVLELAAIPPQASRLDGFRRRSVLPPSWVQSRLPRPVYRALFLAWFVRGVRAESPDIVHAHDAAMLLPALVARRVLGIPFVYDSHELATSVPYRDRAWARFVEVVERVGVPRARAVVTVSDGIAARIQGLYALRSAPVVVRNVSDLSRSAPAFDLRERLGIDPGAPVILHQGAPAPDRGCEALITAMTEVPEATLVFLGDGERSYVEGLTALAARVGVGDRLLMYPAVPLEDLLGITAQASIGVSLLQDTCENHRLALPNKVFEYVTAGIPVVVSDLPEIARLVAGLGAGHAAKPGDEHAIADALRTALDDRDALAATLERRAQEIPRWSTERARLTDLYERLAPGAAR